jgi:hypothetical protein
VGIGTSSPTLASGWNKVLHIHSTGGTGSLIRLTDTVSTSGASADSGLMIGQYSNESYIINRDSGNMRFHTGGTERLRITSVGNIVHNDVTEYSNGFNMNNGTAYDFDITVPSEGGNGNSFFIMCGYNHYYIASYGAHRTSWVSTRSTSLTVISDLTNQSSSNGGAWSFSKPSATTLRVSKSAGSYSGFGSGFVRVIWRNEIG